MPFRSWVVWTVLALATPAWAQPLALRNLGIQADPSGLHLGFDVELTEVDHLVALLERGESLEVRIQARVERLRLGLWGEDIGQGQYQAVLQANPIRQQCTLQEGNSTHEFPCAQLASELGRLWHHRTLFLASFESQVRGQRFEVTVDFRVMRSTVPAWISVPLFFIDWDVVPRQQYQLVFQY
jgi:hypothetical protein